MTLTTRLLALLTASVLSIDSNAQSISTGSIVGRITDARTCAPILYANVIVVGMSIGAMTDRHGVYRISGVPAGVHDVRAMMMFYESRVDTVIAANDSARADFDLYPIWVDHVPPMPPLPANVCSKHFEQMRWVLVPNVRGGVREQWRDSSLLNAWPTTDTEYANRSRFKVGWGESCAQCVEVLNDQRSNGRWKGLPRSTPAAWDQYRIAGVLDFSGPHGLIDSMVANWCTTDHEWRNSNLRVRVTHIPAYQSAIPGAAFPTPDYRVWDVVGDCKADIAVTDQDDAYYATATLASTTNSIDYMCISIIARGKDANKVARTILGTMRFPEPQS